MGSNFFTLTERGIRKSRLPAAWIDCFISLMLDQYGWSNYFFRYSVLLKKIFWHKRCFVHALKACRIFRSQKSSFPVNAQMIYCLRLFLFPPQKQCKRLWCTSAEGDHKGCRTQHMPLADGTDCGHGMVSLSMYRLCEIIYTKMLTILRKKLRVSQLIFKTCLFENVGVDKAAAEPLV